MPRFYLHLKDNAHFIADDEGLELPDPDAAKRVALQSIAHILADELPKGPRRRAPCIIVEDERRSKVAIVAAEVIVQVEA